MSDDEQMSTVFKIWGLHGGRYEDHG